MSEKDGNTTIENLSASVEEENEEFEKEQERRRALACPPVVTHVTYRGLRKIRKMKRNQEVRLHSPISEGEEGHCEVDVGLSASEEEETEQNEAKTGSHVVASPLEVHSGQSNPKTFLSSNSVSSDYQSFASVDSSTVTPNTCSTAKTDEMHSALSSSALQTSTKANINYLDFDPMVTGKMLCANKNSACRSAVLEAVVDGEAHVHESSESESVPLTMESDLEACLQSESHYTDELMFHFLAETPDTPQTQLSNTNTATNLNTHFAKINTASNLHTNITGLNIAPDSCPDSQLSSSGLDGWDHKEIRTPTLSYVAETSGHTAWQAEFILENEDTQQLGVDGETLQLESKKIVESILTNALAALERIDISERENEALSRDEFIEGMENLIFMDAKESMDGAASLGQALREHLPVHGDENPQSSDGTLGSRMQADGSRSTPSSGYESIAGSDTDIRNSGSISADITSTCGLFSMQELQEEAVSGCYPHELELCMERNSASQNNRQDFLHHNTLLLGVNPEDMGEPDKTETNNEQLPKYVLTVSNITSVQPDTFGTLCEVNKGQGQCVVGEYVCFSQKKNDTEQQYSAKDNLESNNHGHALHLNSGDVSTIINTVESSQVEGIRKCLPQVEVSNPVSEHLAENNVVPVQDFSRKEDKPNLSVVQTQAFDVTEPHLVSCENLNKSILVAQEKQSGDTQGSSNYVGTGELSLASDVGSLAYAVEHVLDSKTQEEEKVSADPQPLRLPNSDTLADSSDLDLECFRAVKVTVNDDQSQEDDEFQSDSSIGSSLDRAAGRLAAIPVSSRPHLDLPGTFAIISEEEETDTVFVNDTGPLLSPSTRRVKIYPFSLSPIYEEDSGREDASRDDVLHVPPATEEEQRSVEQQASSILSLLQSVSERLQSSTFSSSETEQDMEDRLDEPEYPQRFLRPIWDRYDDNDDDVTDSESGLLLHQQLTGTTFLSTEAPKDEGSPPNHSPQQKTSGSQDVDLGGNHCETTLTSAVRTANTPFYQYLKSNIVPSLATETLESKAFPNGESSTVTSMVRTLYNI